MANRRLHLLIYRVGFFSLPLLYLELYTYIDVIVTATSAAAAAFISYFFFIQQKMLNCNVYVHFLYRNSFICCFFSFKWSCLRFVAVNLRQTFPIYFNQSIECMYMFCSFDYIVVLANVSLKWNHASKWDFIDIEQWLSLNIIQVLESYSERKHVKILFRRFDTDFLNIFIWPTQLNFDFFFIFKICWPLNYAKV